MSLMWVSFRTISAKSKMKSCDVYVVLFHILSLQVGHASHPSTLAAAPFGHNHGGYSSGGAFGYYG